MCHVPGVYLAALQIVSPFKAVITGTSPRFVVALETHWLGSALQRQFQPDGRSGSEGQGKMQKVQTQTWHIACPGTTVWRHSSCHHKVCYCVILRGCVCRQSTWQTECCRNLHGSCQQGTGHSASDLCCCLAARQAAVPNLVPGMKCDCSNELNKHTNVLKHLCQPV